MTKILITGASGFIGRYLMQTMMAAKHTVLGTSSRGVSPDLMACDITDLDQVQTVFKDFNPDIIIHSAALSSVTKGKTLDYYRINVLGTENVIKATNALEGRRRIIFLSTAGVYGNQGVEILSEYLCPKPVSHYGLSKFAAERLMCNEMEAHDVTILRLFNVIGTGQDDSFIVPKLVQHFKAKAAHIELGNVASERDYLPVATISQVVLDLLDKSLSYGEIINVCEGKGLSVQSLLKVMSDLTGHNINVIVSEKFLRKNEVKRLVGSATRLEHVLGHEIPQSDLRATLQEMLD